MPTEIGKTLYVKTREEWRAWLEENHASEKEIWLVCYKKGSGQPRVPYEDAVEEALCFGWIDSLLKPIDADKFAQKFSPRRPTSKWSEPNRHRVARLIKDGLMTEAGLAVITYEHPERAPEKARPRSEREPLRLPPYFKRALVASPAAWENWTKLAPSQRRLYLAWIRDAKKQETRDKRVREAVARLEQNKKLGMK